MPPAQADMGCTLNDSYELHMKRVRDEVVAEPVTCHEQAKLHAAAAAGLPMIPTEIVGVVIDYLHNAKDVSALACTCTHIHELLYEQYTGHLYVDSHDELEYLRRYTRIRGVSLPACLLSVKSRHMYGIIPMPLSVRKVTIRAYPENECKSNTSHLEQYASN